MNPQPASKSRHAQQGVGLIEVLVATLLLAIGVLGIAALQEKALVSGGDAFGRTAATLASYTIIDALALDPANVQAGAYNVTVKAGACPSADNQVDTTLSLWCGDLAENVGPTATGSVNCTSLGACTITLNWTATAIRDQPDETLVTTAQVEVPN